jgi:hypothetical protein
MRGILKGSINAILSPSSRIKLFISNVTAIDQIFIIEMEGQTVSKHEMDERK